MSAEEVLCECGCCEPVNGVYLAVLALADRGRTTREIEVLTGIPFHSVKRYRSLARRGEWPRFLRGHHPATYSRDRGECLACGRVLSVNNDGCVRRHPPLEGSAALWCPGSNDMPYRLVEPTVACRGAA